VPLDKAQLKGWKKGLKMRKEKMLENRQKMHEKGRRIGYRIRRKEGLEEGEKVAGHREELCILKKAHIQPWQLDLHIS
jgi:hypothetical protein